MFLHLFVILFKRGVEFPVWITGHITGGLYSGGVKQRRGGYYGYGQKAGGTHPTAMHSVHTV